MLAIAASWVGRLKVERSIATAAVRAVVQLAAVALVITAVLSQLAWSLAFAAFMFGVAVFTSSRRIEAPRAWPWVAVAIACGVVPGLTVIFLSGEVVERRWPEALVPALDQTRTVGLVTLPGAFVGVLLGGGTAIQAGAVQVLVLIGLLAAETVTVVVAYQLMKASRLLPPDLRSRLIA